MTTRTLPKAKPHRLHVVLDAAQFKALTQIRKTTGTPVAFLLRQAIAAYLAAPATEAEPK